MEANYGILALIPPVVAIGLCFATKQVLISMFAGLFAGALVISNWNPFAAASYSLDALATNMADNVVLLLFTLRRAFQPGTVHIIEEDDMFEPE